jgi:hypothetical protein
MYRIIATLIAATLALFVMLAAPPAFAAAADLYSITGVQVDATAESATAAREQALAQGRPLAWQRLFRRLTPPAAWPRQPNLDDNALQRAIRSFEVSNERRSTTRYLGEMTYHFNQGEVVRLLRQSGIPFAETQSKPVLVVPLIGGRYDPAGAWAKAWTSPSIAQGLVPVVLPTGDAADQIILTRPDLGQLDWVALAPLVRRYGVTQIVIATATPDGNAAQLIEISQTGRQTESLAFARSNFLATADAAAVKIAEGWKNRVAVDFSQRGRLSVDVSFSSLGEWSRIRSQLVAVRSVTGVEVVGLSVAEARVELGYVGRPEQLRDTLAEQDLDLRMAGGNYTLAIGVPQPQPVPLVPR